jgi:DNA repair protein REV1
MSSTSSGRRAPSTAAAAASPPGQKRARDEACGGSPSDPNSATPAKNPRRAFRSSPFADFGSYMAAKNSKLAAQFEADASTSVAVAGGLFSGVSIFVDGFTIPSSQVSAAYRHLISISHT